MSPAAAEAALGAPPAGSCLRFADASGWADIPADASGMSRLTSDAATFEAWINTSAAPGAFNGQVIYIGQNDPGASLSRGRIPITRSGLPCLCTAPTFGNVGHPSGRDGAL